MFEISDRNIFELSQINLIKVLSLEISGFETPGTKLGIYDAEITMSAICELILLELKRLNLSTAHHEKLERLIKSNEEFFAVSTKNINAFDHLSFLKKHLIPLYHACVALHEASGIEFASEVISLPQSINWHSKSPFSKTFLNASFYSRIQTKDSLKIKLGKLLFYDPILSKNNQRACASCHLPQRAFTDGKKKSTAFNLEGTVQRNSPTLTNVVYSSAFFYDLRAEMMGQQIEHVVHSPLEFSTNFSEIEAKLSQFPDYIALFKKAFPEAGGEINKPNLVTALSAFTQSQIAWNSPFDKHLNSSGTSLDQDAIAGFNLFMGKAQCGTCHFAPNFSGLAAPWFEESESENIGTIEKWDTLHPKIDSDKGRSVSSKVKDRSSIFEGHFKTPTLRNIAFTAPYMHNGGLETL